VKAALYWSNAALGDECRAKWVAEHPVERDSASDRPLHSAPASAVPFPDVPGTTRSRLAARKLS